MLLTKPNPYISQPLRNAGNASWVLALPILHGSQAVAAKWHAWRRIIELLKDWQQDPARLEDEGVDAPAPETIQAAILLAESHQAQGTAPPDHVVCDPNGGIVFRRHEEDKSEELHLSEDGREYRFFDGTCLVERRRL